VKPWTGVAEFSLAAEKELQAMEGYALPFPLLLLVTNRSHSFSTTSSLPLSIVRPAIIYGPGDVSGLCT